MCVPAAHGFSSCTAPHRMAPHGTAAPSRPAREPARLPSRHLQATLLPSRFSKPARTTDRTGSAHVGPLGVWRRSRGGPAPGGRGSGRMMRAMQRVKAVMVVLVLGGGSSGQGAEFAARKVCTACLHGLPHLTGGCCVVESADSVCWEDP